MVYPGICGGVFSPTAILSALLAHTSYALSLEDVFRPTQLAINWVIV